MITAFSHGPLYKEAIGKASFICINEFENFFFLFIGISVVSLDFLTCCFSLLYFR